MAAVEAVVFDLDGVLIDSEPVWEDVRRHLVAERGGRWLPDSQRRLMGMSTPEWARYLSAELGVGLPPGEVARVVVSRIAARYAEHVPLLPGAVAAVERMAARWPLAIASSSPRSLIDRVLDRVGLAGRFAVVVSTEELPRGKPAPDVYLAAADGLDAAPSRCVAVEDSSNGVRSAVAAGMRVIAIPGPHYPLDPDAASAARVLPDLDALTTETLQGVA